MTQKSRYWTTDPPLGARRLAERVRAWAAERPGEWLCVEGFPTANARRNAVVRLRRQLGGRFEFGGKGPKLYVRIKPAGE